MQVKKLLLEIFRKKKEPKNDKRKKSVSTTLDLVPYEPVIRSTADNFVDKIGTVGDCWEWQGELDRYGYGKFRVGRKIVKAHRYSFEFYHGEFDKNLHVLHTCDNPKCVNPNHLFLGTHQDNIIDKVNKGRQKFMMHRLTVNERTQVVQALLENIPKKQIADRFSISINTVKRLSKKSCV